MGNSGHIGDRGEKGEQGNVGERGDRGEKGDKGDRGNRGEVGQRGEIQQVYLNKDSVVTNISKNENRVLKPQIKIIKKQEEIDTI